MAEPIPPPTPAQLVVLRSLLIPLMRFSGLVVALGLIFCVDAWVRAMFGTLTGSIGWIPYIGRVVTSPLHRIEQKVTSYLGGLEAHIDVSMGAFFHNLAIAVDMLASGQAEIAWLSWLMAHALKVAHGVTKVLPTITHITKVTNVVKGDVKVIREKVVHVTKVVGTKADAVVGHRVGAIEGELGHVIEWDIPNLRARARTIEHGLSRLFNWVRTHPLAIPQALAIAAVAHGLGKLGGSWIRCNNWNRIGRSVCRLPLGLVEEIFGGAIVTFAVLDICDFAAAAQSVASAFVPEFMALVDVEDALIGCHGATAAPLLTLPALHLPPENLGLTLAA